MWVTMLAMSDREGMVMASVPGLADRARVTIAECLVALGVLRSPDEWSRNKADDGRRIVEVEGGWRLLNHGKYRSLMSREERREYNRIKQQERRERLKRNDRAARVEGASAAVGELLEKVEGVCGQCGQPGECWQTGMGLVCGRCKIPRT